jgi:hypothetical protein
MAKNVPHPGNRGLREAQIFDGLLDVADLESVGARKFRNVFDLRYVTLALEHRE